jgi:hypothetical protein
MYAIIICRMLQKSLLLAIAVFGLSLTSSQSTHAIDTSTLGIDVGFPQCGTILPTNQAFGIVSVNGGKASNINPCLRDQLLWAQSSTSLSPNQPKLQLYLNTASPGNYYKNTKLVANWPKDSIDPSGYNTGYNCSGGNTIACARQYGWERAQEAIGYFRRTATTIDGLDANPAAYMWWLDVETLNTWHSGRERDGYKKNVATLEGYADYFAKKAALTRFGIYSTNPQWKQIVGTGNIARTSPLRPAPTWYAIGTGFTIDNAHKVCVSNSPDYQPLAGTVGSIELVQFVSDNLDYNYSCI